LKLAKTKKFSKYFIEEAVQQQQVLLFPQQVRSVVMVIPVS